ncbi:hypothetical protein niasHT_014428 [Heterodera trifolii]|uniref:TGS domain-containing protein n=1 Tax=Heterodera trifolii TaxID=157864 RepID=A0ABD2LHD0_9BILA
MGVGFPFRANGSCSLRVRISLCLQGARFVELVVGWDGWASIRHRLTMQGMPHGMAAYVGSQARNREAPGRKTFPLLRIHSTQMRVEWRVEDHSDSIWLVVSIYKTVVVLSHVGACDALFHLCSSFEDTEVTHVEGDVDPIRDLEIINSELRLKDQAYLVGALDKVEKWAVKSWLETKFVRQHEWNEKEIEVLNKHLFLTAKPIVYLVNLSEQDLHQKEEQMASENQSVLIPFSGAFELKSVELDPEARAQFFKDTGACSALDKIIKTGYKTLCLEYFFTAGKDEVRAWTIQKGTKAPQGAGRIHTDFEKGFIMAEVMKVADLVELGSENAVKGAGKYRQQGRNYVVEDGDIIFFKFNAGAGLTAAKKK